MIKVMGSGQHIRILQNCSVVTEVYSIQVMCENFLVIMLKCLYKFPSEWFSLFSQKYDGGFVNVLKSCDQNAARVLQTIVSEFPSYRDEALYGGRRGRDEGLKSIL